MPPDKTAMFAEVVVAAIKAAVAPLAANQQAMIARLAEIEARTLVANGDLGNARERLAALEVRSLIPGPAGKDGAPGIDGFACDELIATQDPADDRIVTLAYRRGEVTKSIATVHLTTPRYLGVYDAGREYVKGDRVTLGGSEWHCNAEKSYGRPGNGSKDWILAVKCGRDGKDAPRIEARA